MQRPSKRPRTAGSFSLSGLSPQEVDVEEARKENDLRLKSRFEHIFEKYGRDFGTTADEIDLATGEIVINNGHIQEMDNEQDVGRGLWDAFHPEEEPEDGVKPATEPATEPAGNPELPDGRPFGEVDGDVDVDILGSEHGLELPEPPRKIRRPLASGTPLTTPPAKLPYLHRSPSPPNTGSIWAVPNRGRRPTKTREQPKIVRSTRPRDRGRDSPDSDDPLNGDFTSPSKTRSPSHLARSDRRNVIHTPSKARNYEQQDKQTTVAATSRGGTQTPRTAITSRTLLSHDPDASPMEPERPHPRATISISPQLSSPILPDLSPALEMDVTPRALLEDSQEVSPVQHIESTPKEQDDDLDVQPTHSGVDQHQEMTPDSPTKASMNGVPPHPPPEQQIVPSATPTATREAVSHIPTAAEDSQPKDPTPTEGLASTGSSRESQQSTLSPHEIQQIVTLRMVQKLPWRKVFESANISHPNSRQLKQLYRIRNKMESTAAQSSLAWTPHERTVIKSFRPKSDVSWETIQSSLPQRSIEEIQCEWMRSCFEGGSINCEAARASAAASTPSGRSNVDAFTRTFSTPAQSPLIDLEESSRKPRPSERERSESPDPLSAALEDSLVVGSGLSTLQIDTPPKRVQKKKSQCSFQRGAASPMANRQSKKLLIR